MAGIYKRKRPWRDSFCWEFMDRVEHYFRLKSIPLDKAVFLAVGLIPEKYEGWGVPWFDTIFISNARGYEPGDDADAVWQWMEDCKDRWESEGRPTEGLNLREFIDWVSTEYETPHWMRELQASGEWEEWTAHLAVSTSPDRRALARDLLAKHHGNKSAVAREMGISRTRVGQLVDDAKPTQPLAVAASDPFGISCKPLKTKRK